MMAHNGLLRIHFFTGSVSPDSLAGAFATIKSNSSFEIFSESLGDEVTYFFQK